MAVAADRYQSRREQEFADLERWPKSSHAGNVGVDDLLLAYRSVGERDQVDLDDAADGRKGFGRHHRNRARDASVITTPHVEAVRHVGNVGKIDLCLD